MIDSEIKYPREIDTLPITDEMTSYVSENINSLREAIINLEETLGLNIDVGIFTNSDERPTLAERLRRIESGIAEHNLVLKELNVDDCLAVQKNFRGNSIVRVGKSTPQEVCQVLIMGPLNILSTGPGNIPTIINTPIKIDLSEVDKELSTNSLIKGKGSISQPLLKIQDTNSKDILAQNKIQTLVIDGNCTINGFLNAKFSISHEQILSTETTPNENTRGIVKHVFQGDYHTHKKGLFDQEKQTWIVDTTVDEKAFGILNHLDLVGIGTLPEHVDSFIPRKDIAYHVTYGDMHKHSSEGDGAQVDHNDLKNINPKISNHVTGGDWHIHSKLKGDGGAITHSDLSEIETIGEGAIHVTYGDAHSHSLDDEGNVVGDGAQINHKHLTNIESLGEGAIHVTLGGLHQHDPEIPGSGGIIDHAKLSNIGTLSHPELEEMLSDHGDLLNEYQNHSHAPGSGGQPITPAGLLINSDLSMGGWSLNNLRSTNFADLSQTLAGVENKDRLYVTNGDLWYTGSNGIPVRVTIGSGSVSLGEFAVGSVDISPNQINKMVFTLPSKAVSFDGNVYIKLQHWIEDSQTYSEYFKIYGVKLSDTQWEIQASSVGDNLSGYDNPIIFGMLSDGTLAYNSNGDFASGKLRFEYNAIDF